MITINFYLITDFFNKTLTLIIYEINLLTIIFFKENVIEDDPHSPSEKFGLGNEHPTGKSKVILSIYNMYTL